MIEKDESKFEAKPPEYKAKSALAVAWTVAQKHLDLKDGDPSKRELPDSSEQKNKTSPEGVAQDL